MIKYFSLARFSAKKPLAIMLLLVIAITMGCSKSGPPVKYVEGTVMYDGKPLHKALVSFFPEKEGEGLTAIGQTDENGMFRLTATQGGQPNQGTVPGTYIVVITRNKDEPSSTKQFKGIDGQAISLGVYDSMIPKRYTLSTTSDLRAVVEKKRNNFTFEIPTK